MPQRLPRFDRAQERIEDAQKIAKLILETGGLPDEADGNGKTSRKVLRSSADGHNPQRLRGLPAIGRNVSGATVHTDPVKALLEKERRGELNR